MSVHFGEGKAGRGMLFQSQNFSHDLKIAAVSNVWIGVTSPDPLGGLFRPTALINSPTNQLSQLNRFLRFKLGIPLRLILAE